MTSPNETRVRTALRELAQTAPAHPDVASVMAAPKPGPGRPRPWRAPALVAAAVVLIVAAVVFLPVPSKRGQPPGAGDPSLPERFPGFSFVQGYLDGPFGRAIALYRNGSGHEDFGFFQTIVAGADRNVYRRLEIPTQNSYRAHPRLSPDGTKVAVGALENSPSGLRVIDLLTGRAKGYERHPAPLGRTLTPLAFSPDGRRVAYIATVWAEISGPLYLLDLETGESVPVTGENVQTVAFSPDGTRIAYQTRSQDALTLRVGGLDGTLEQAPDVPARADLAGPYAWTPDGRYLVMVARGPERTEGNVYYDGDRSFVFIDMTGGSAPFLAPIPANDLMPRAWGNSVLGWRSASAMLISTGDVDGTTSNLIVELDIRTGSHRIISRFDVGPRDDLAVGDVQLATALLPTAGMRPDGPADRGTWPRWAIITTIVCAAPLILTTTVFVWLLRLRRRPLPR